MLQIKLFLRNELANLIKEQNSVGLSTFSKILEQKNFKF